MRRRTSESSLDLLLDTICNTFGGVLFLAILVALLLKTTAKDVFEAEESKHSPAEVNQMATEQIELVSRLEALQLAVQQQEQLRNRFASPDAEARLKALETLRKERDKLLAQQMTALAETAQAVSAAGELEAELASLDQKLEAERERKTDAEEALNSEIESRSQAARLPRQRYSNKSEVTLIVRFGRLYVWHLYDRSGRRLGLNLAEFVIVDESGGKQKVMPKPFAGVELAPGREADVKARLRQFNPATKHFAIAIWGDSFESFSILKNCMVEEGYEYRLLLIKEGGTIIDRGGDGGPVQ